MDANAAAQQMLTNSDHFFRYYPVIMSGGVGAFNPNVHNPKTYYLTKKQGSLGKEGHHGATRPGFLHTKNISSFQMEIFAMPTSSGPLVTDGIPMVNYNSNKDGKVNLNGNIVAMDHYVASAGVNYLTTGLLTGCCFAWVANGGELWCTHIRPEGTNGATLQTDLDTNGSFNLAPGQALRTFGRNDYGGSYATVIGVNTAAGWKLYAQASLDTFKTITTAWRLHPGPAVQL